MKMEAIEEKFNIPTTRYSGSKRQFLDWIWSNISNIKFKTALDLFGGTGSVSLFLKERGKEVYYNDILKFNQIIGTAIIENSKTIVSEDELEKLFSLKTKEHSDIIQRYYRNIFYLDEENRWLDSFIYKTNLIKDKYKRSIILSALFQACLSKRPFNLFHRANLTIRTNDVKRNFGNKTTWERSFEELISKFVCEYNKAVIDNGKSNKVIGGFDALLCPNGVDLVYIDPPYVSNKRPAGLNYLKYYSFLEGIAHYDSWENLILDLNTNIPRLKSNEAIKNFSEKSKIKESLDKLIERFQNNIIVMSYLDDGFPTKEEIISIFKKHGKKVTVKSKKHKYVLSNKSKNELLFIAK